MEAQPTTFAPAISLSQWKSKEMSQSGWLNGGGNQWMNTNGDNSSMQPSNSDWGAKGPPPNGLVDQKKTNGWPAISNSNGMKPGDFSSMNSSNSGDGLVSSDQSLGTSIWGSGTPGWGGVGSDKSEAVTASFNPSLSVAGGTTTAPSSSSSATSGSPWSQGPSTNTIVSPSSTGGASFTTSSGSTQWSVAPQESHQSGLQSKAETSTTSAAPSTIPTASAPGDAPISSGGGDKAPTDSNVPTSSDQGNNNNNMKNGWQGGQTSGDTSWNQQKGGSGWGPVTPTSDGPSGWGDPPSSSAPGNTSGWGTLPTSGSNTTAPTGWGQSNKVEDHEALGTDIWGAKSSSGPASTPSAWGKPPSGGPPNQWDKPPAGRGWGELPSVPVGSGGPPTGWGDPSADTVPKAPPQSGWGIPGNQGLSGMPKGVVVGANQWGKKPVDQGTKWQVAAEKNNQNTDNGTGVWNSQMQNPPPPPPNAWNKEPPKSPWGIPGHHQQQPPQQQPQPPMKPPQPSESAWGSSVPKAWGNPDEPKPPAWGQPPNQPWNQHNSHPDSNRGGAWGAPPPSKPPPSDNNYGSWNKDDIDPKKQMPQQQAYPQSGQSQSAPAPSGSGWMPMLDIPQEIVPTGWGQLSPADQDKPFGMDDGTYVWGDSKEHNAWVTQMSAKNVLRMKQLKQKAAAAAAAAAAAGGNPTTSTMQSPTVPTSKPPSTPGSEDGSTATAVASSFGGGAGASGNADQKKPDWEDTPGTPTSTTSSRPKSESGEAAEWQSLPRPPSEEGNKWKGDNPAAPPTTTATWNRSSSAQSMDSMQKWNEEPPSSTPSSMGHWGDDDWDKRSQVSDNSSGAAIRRRPSENPINGNRNPSQIALKLRALTDKGYPREEAEAMLQKHNMDFDRALEDLRGLFGGSDPIKTNSELDTKFSAMALHGNGSGTDMSGNLSMMQNMRNKGMTNLGTMGGPGFPGQGLQNQRMPMQKFPGQMSSGGNQSMRSGGGPFCSMQQQQQQQLMQAVAGLNLNINSPQQLLHALQQNPQLLAQLQNIQQQQQSGNKPGFYRNQFMNQSQSMGGGISRPPGRAPFSNDMVNPNILSGFGAGDMGVSQPQQSRMEQFFNKQQRQQQPPQQARPFGRNPPVGGFSKPMPSIENSRSASPAASESQPNSADSAFSDSSSAWPFSHSGADDQGDGVPEFKPGVPWKPRTSDIANDPDATPGSVNSFSASLTVGKTPGREREKHDHELEGILTRPMRPNNTQVWSSQGGNRRSQSTSGGWNYSDGGYQRQQSFPGIGMSRPSRPGPPPGLENNPRNNWSRGGSGNWGDSPGTWSGNDGMNVGSNWLMLRNLGNVDSSYLHVLCNQNGTVEQFNLNQSQGMALVAYKSRDEAMKTRQSLGSLGISVTFVNPNEIGSMIGGGAANPGSQWSTGQNKVGWDDGSNSSGRSQWNAGGSGGIAGGSGGIAGGIGLPGMPGSLWSPTPGPMGGGMDVGSGIGGMTNWSGGDMPGSHNNFGSFLPGDLLN